MQYFCILNLYTCEEIISVILQNNLIIILKKIRMVSVVLETIHFHLKSFVQSFAITQFYPGVSWLTFYDFPAILVLPALHSYCFKSMLPKIVTIVYALFPSNSMFSLAVSAALKAFPLTFLLATYVHMCFQNLSPSLHSYIKFCLSHVAY